MFSDITMDLIKEEIKEETDKDDNFLPLSAPGNNGEETKR